MRSPDADGMSEQPRRRFRLVPARNGFEVRLVGREPVIDVYAGFARLDDPPVIFPEFGPEHFFPVPAERDASGARPETIYLAWREVENGQRYRQMIDPRSPR